MSGPTAAPGLQPNDAPRLWAVAGGLTIGGFAAGLGGLGAPISSPSGLLIVERKLIRYLWAIGMVNAGYQQQGIGDEQGLGGPQTFSSGFIDGGIGLRSVFTPDDRFRFSSYLVVGGGYSRTRTRSADELSDMTLQSGNVSARVGLTLEHAIAKDVLLGASTDLARGVFAVNHRASTTNGVEDDSVRDDAWFWGLVLQPALQARFFF